MSAPAIRPSSPPWRRLLARPARWSLATQTLVLQASVAVTVVIAGLGGAYVQAQKAGSREASAQVLAVARAVAVDARVIEALQQPDPSPRLQPLAESVRQSTGTDFVVVMNPRGLRYSHPNPALIGGQFSGHIDQALAGGSVVEDYTGSLGPSRRAVVPVIARRTVIGLVSVGIVKSQVSERLRGQLPALGLAAVLAALLAGAGTALVARRVRRQTRGLGARQLQEMIEYYDAVLHAVTEGLVLTDREGRVRLVNDEAVRLLGLTTPVTDRPLADLDLAPALVAALTDTAPRSDEVHVTAQRVLVVNTAPATWRGRPLGAVATLRDRTDLEHLTGELDQARSLADALHAQAHEAANRLHTIVSLIDLGETDQAVAFATEELDLAQRFTDQVISAVEEPALSALLLGKSAQAAERGIEFIVEQASRWPAGVAGARDVVTIAGNLIDNAFDAVSAAPTPRRVSIAARIDEPAGQVPVAELTVADSGPGLPEAIRQAAFVRGFSTKSPGPLGRRGVGLALVAQTVERLGGTITHSGPPGARFVVRLPWHESEGFEPSGG